MIRTQAILFTGVGRVETGEVEIPEPGSGELLVEAAYTATSPGTELRCLAGKQDGSREWPFIPGYAMTGRVAACGPGVSLPPGTPVLCAGTSRASVHRLWGGHVGHAVAPAERVFPLPDGVDLRDASLGMLAAIAYHGLRLSRPLPHETVAVAGLGPVGQLSARLHALTGARVVGLDPDPRRVEVARGAGIEAHAVQGSLRETWDRISPRDADVIVDATGSAPVLHEAIELAADKPRDSPMPGARFLIQGSYAEDYSLPHHRAFMKELTFFLPRDRQPLDVRAVLDLMSRGLLQVGDLAGEPRAPEEAPQTYAELQDKRRLTAVFRWR